MANFCNKCGNRLDIGTGLCPRCDSEKIISIVNKNMAMKAEPKPAFCNKCGSKYDIKTGLCPNCDYEQFDFSVKEVEEIPVKSVSAFCYKCGNRLDAKTGLCLNCENSKLITAVNWVETVKNKPVVDSYKNNDVGVDTETDSEEIESSLPEEDEIPTQIPQDENKTETSVARFCDKCGNEYDIETGLCPNCDREKFTSALQNEKMNYNYNSQNNQRVTPAVGFCNKCGSRIDVNTGLCPNCTRENNTTDPYTYYGFAPQNKNSNNKNNGMANSKPMNRNSGGTTVLSVFLSICLVLNLLFAVVLYDLRSMTDKKGFEELFSDVKTTDFIYDSGFASEEDIEEFYEELGENFDSEIEDKEFDKFIDKSTVKEFMADKFADFFEDFFNGEDAELVIKKNEVVTLLKQNSDEFEEELGTELTNDKINDFADWFCGDKGQLVVVNTEMIKEDLPGVHFLLSIGLSYITIAVFVILSLLCIALLLRNSLWQGMLGIGISFMVFAYITGFIGLFAGYIPYLWSLMTSFAPFAGGLVGILMTESLLISFVLFVLGIALIVSRKFLRKYFNS